MGKTLLFLLMVSWKLSFCLSALCLFMGRNTRQHTEVMLSEVLFNPKTGGVDFIEIYNPADRSLSLNDIRLANIDASGAIGNFRPLGPGTIGSGEYWVISTSSARVKADYYTANPGHFIQLSTLPAYNNTSGHVILCRGSQVIDRLDYTEKMHMSILNSVDGVSLERVSFDRATNQPGNFLSAAASVGFATPGYANSVAEVPGLEHDKLIAGSQSFSPDQDGFEDVYRITYQLKHHGNVATVTIFSDKGLLVKNLIKNESVATTGTITWDGMGDNGQRCPFGIYILVFDSFNQQGHTVRLKKAFALVGKFN
jgi:hypothetical protein